VRVGNAFRAAAAPGVATWYRSQARPPWAAVPARTPHGVAAEAGQIAAFAGLEKRACASRTP